MAKMWKLVVLIAVLLMPLGMQPAAAARVAPHGASVPMQHCPDPAGSHDSKGGFAECTMACSAALPALDAPPPHAMLIVCAPPRPGIVHQLHGLHPDTATPPPKRT